MYPKGREGKGPTSKERVGNERRGEKGREGWGEEMGGQRRVGEGRGGEGKSEKPPPDSIATTGAMHKGRIPCVACLYGHKITANNEESEHKRKEKIGEGGNGWGQGRDKKEIRGEEKGRRELRGDRE